MTLSDRDWDLISQANFAITPDALRCYGGNLADILLAAEAEGVDRLWISGVDFRLRTTGVWEALEHD